MNLALALASCATLQSAERGPWPVPVARATSGVIVEPGDRQVCVEWNPGLEDGAVTGYEVRCSDRLGVRETVGVVTEPHLVCTGRLNGATYEFQVRNRVGATWGPWSASERATPRRVAAPRVTDGPATVRVPGFPDVHLVSALTIAFENGHTILFDKVNARVRDWITPEQRHLMYPKVYGNALDIGRLNSLGDYRVHREGRASECDEAAPSSAEPFHPAVKCNRDNFDDPRNVAYVGHTICDNRITIEYRLALNGHADAIIWETWGPVALTLGIGKTTAYGGLTRKIEIKMPASFDEGYVICPHDGFGVSGSCAGGVSYHNHWVSKSNHTRPCIVETRWSPAHDGSVEFRDTGTWIQNQPYLFTDFAGSGTLVIASRRANLATMFRPRNYVAQGQNGVWPNLRITCSQRGARHAIETFEYLWTSDQALPLPQKYIDVKTFMMRRLAHRYGLDPNLHTTTHKHSYLAFRWERAMNGLSDEKKIQFLARKGAEALQEMTDLHANFLTTKYWTWLTGPAATHQIPFAGSDDIRLNPSHPLNRMVTEAWVLPFREKGIRFGFHWAAPEEVRADYPEVLQPKYAGEHSEQTAGMVPGNRDWVTRQGFPLIRENTNWLRKGKDGTIPKGPMGPAAMTVYGGYYDQLVYQHWQMLKTMGFDSLFIGDGTCQLDGVDYSSGEPRALQPFMWKMFRDIHAAGLILQHELQTGFSAYNEHGRFNTAASEALKWGVAHSSCGRHQTPEDPDLRHRMHQLYCQLHVAGAPAVADFAAAFFAAAGAPDRIFLDGVHWDQLGSKWEWRGVIWEFRDGRRIRYPNYSEIGKNPDTNPPETPGGFKASVAREDGQVELTWQPVIGASGYNVYRATEPQGTYARLNPSLLTVPRFTDQRDGVNPVLYYVVAAEDACQNQSPYSCEERIEPMSLRP